MESKLKAAAQDSVGEVYENLLLRESGYPHLPDPVFVPEKKPSECKECKGKGWVFVGFGEDYECETCFDKSPESENIVEQSQSDAWNDAGTKPDVEKVYETRSSENQTSALYQFWDGEWWASYAFSHEDAALPFIAGKISGTQHVQWREVQE